VTDPCIFLERTKHKFASFPLSFHGRWKNEFDKEHQLHHSTAKASDNFHLVTL